MESQNEKDLIQEFKDLYENLQDADVIFVSKDKQQIKAHKLILSLSSSFFRNLFNELAQPPDGVYKLILPSYSTLSISKFIQFFYTGESLLDENLVAEFAYLCQEFNCEEIPAIKTLVKNHKVTEKAAVDDSIITRILEEEYFESNENVETIFFNENDCCEAEFNETPGIDVKKEIAMETDEVRDVKEEYTNVQYIDENPNFEMIEETEKASDSIEFDIKTEIPQAKELLDSLDQAAADMRTGMSFYDAHKKYGVPRGMILKHLQQQNEQSQARKKVKKTIPQPTAPTVSFPAVVMNINQLREEQDRFKKRLQEAINSCRDAGNSSKKAAKIFGVPVEAIERNLRGFKKNMNS